MPEYEKADERIECECNNITVGSHFRQRLPQEHLDEYDLKNTVIDMVVSQGDTSFSVSDVEVDSQGRIRGPAKKARLYGLEPGEPMTVFIDRVALR